MSWSFPIKITTYKQVYALLTERLGKRKAARNVPRRRSPRRRPQLLRQKLRQIRGELDITQVELIKRLGLTGFVDAIEISDYERGVREPDLLTLKAYADGAGISTDDLIDDNVELPRKLPVAKPKEESSEPSKDEPKQP